MKTRNPITSLIIAGLLLCGVLTTQAQPVITVPPQSRVETVGDHLAFSVGATGASLSYQWFVNTTNILGATNYYYVITDAQVTNSGTYTVLVTNAGGAVSNSATLEITTGLQALSSTNIVVVRVGDGSQAMSFTTGNTVYLDQYESNGTYVNTIQIPDTLPNALILSGAPTNGAYMGFLGRSVNSAYLTLGGYNVHQPNEDGLNIAQSSSRAIGVIGANGYFAVAQTNNNYYTASPRAFISVASTDGLTNFWITGTGASDGVRYTQVGINTTSYNSLLSPGKTSHVVDIDPSGNVAFTASNSAGFTGLSVYSGLALDSNDLSTLIISVPTTASLEDFAISPDYNTIYIADDSGTATAGIERWDNESGTWVNTYTLASGAAKGASGLTVNFGASATWGQGVAGAVLYSTTAGGGSNSLIKIVDNGAGSTPVILATAGPNQILRGLRFGPVPVPPAIAVAPQAGEVYTNGTAYFYVVASGNLPFTYQWQLNGTNILGATNYNLTVMDPVGTNLGNYTVVVENAAGSITSTGVGLTVGPLPTAPYPVTVLNDNPLAFWRLDETNGSIAHDYMNGFYDGTYYNVQLGHLPGYNSFTDSGESAVQFEPTVHASDVSGIPVDLSTTNNTDFSVEAWINTEGLASLGNIVTVKAVGRYQFLLDTSAGGVSGSPEFSISSGGFNYSEFFAEDTNFVISDGNWHHIVGVCDQDNATLSLYVDGQLIASTNATGEQMKGLLDVDFTNADVYSTLSWGPPVGTLLYEQEFAYDLTDTNMFIGGQDAMGDDGGFIGFISQVAIYNYALTASQVSNHYFSAGIVPSSVTISPPAPLVNSGQTIELMATAPAATQPLYWQWSSNGVPLPWATNPTVVLTNLQGEINFNCSIVVSNAYGSAQASEVVTVYAGALQLVTDIQPTEATNGYGGTQVFSAAIQGSSPVSYQWQFNGMNLSDTNGVLGSHTESLTLSPLELAEAGNYQLQASNSFGTNASSLGNLVVEPLTFTLPNLWATNRYYGPQPGFSDGTLTLTAGTGQEYDSVFGDLPIDISAFKASWIYQETATTNESSGNGPGDGYAFVIQNNPAGVSALSDGELGWTSGGNLNAIDNGIDYSVALEFGIYTGVYYLVGSNVPTAPGIAVGTNGVAYGYEGSGYAGPFMPTGDVNLASGDPIKVAVSYGAGNMSVSLTDTTTSATFSTNFAIDIPGIVQSNTALVGFTGSCESVMEDTSIQQISGFSFAAAAAVSVAPASQVADAGQTVTFNAIPYPTNAPITYQWSSNSVVLSWATNSTLILTNVGGSSNQTYSVAISNSVGTAEGTGALTVYSGAPQILTNLPTNVVAAINDSLVLSASVVGTYPITFQWQFDGTNLSNGTGIAGALTSSLTLSDVQYAAAGYYQLLASNSIGTNATSVATLSVVTLSLEAASDWTINTNGLPVGAEAGTISGGVLTLTDTNEEEAVSAYWDTPVNVQNFVASWTFLDSDGAGRGYTFVLQNAGLTALGGTAINLGYSGIQDSVAVQFNTYPYDTGIALGIDGTVPADLGGTASLSLTNGDPLDFTVVYSGSNLSVTIVDTLAEITFSTNYSVNIPATVLGNTAYVGFTGGDGFVTSVQQVSQFSFFNFPTLTAQKASGGGLVFTWPTGEGIVLQENTNLGSTNWVNITNMPSIVSGNYQLMINPGTTNAYFRLAIPPP